MNAGGLTEVLNESFNPGEKDYSALVSKMKDATIDAVYIGGYHTEGALILKQMREQGLAAQMLSGDSMNNAEFWTIAGEAASGMIFTFAPEPRAIPAAKAVVEKFKAEGYDPEGYTLYTYAAIQMYAAAVPPQAARTTRSWLNGCALATSFQPFWANSPWTQRATSRTPSMSGTSSQTAPMPRIHQSNNLRIS